MKPRHALPLLAGLSMLAGCGQHSKQEAHHVPPGAQRTPALPSLDGLIRFSDPKQCEFAEPMERLFASLIRTNADHMLAAGQPAIPRAYAAAFGKPTSITAADHLLTVTLPVRGAWRGLRVVSVAASAMPESDVGWTTIRFAASKQAVVQKLNEAGMTLPASGKRAHDDPDDPMQWPRRLWRTEP